jgi:hypothetical protein
MTTFKLSLCAWPFEVGESSCDLRMLQEWASVVSRAGNAELSFQQCDTFANESQVLNKKKGTNG